MMNAYRAHNDEIVCITQLRCIVFDSKFEKKSEQLILGGKLDFIDGVQDFELGW